MVWREEQEIALDDHGGNDQDPQLDGDEERDRALAELLVNPVIGLTSLKTVKFTGEIKGKKVIVMVDLRATHNFILVNLVRKWGMVVDKTELRGDFGHRTDSERRGWSLKCMW